ncbi:MAG TPA: DUF2891 family protein [Candidatus Tumulicola sp.]|jgi:hypothetical protein
MDALQAALAPQIAPVVVANVTTRYPYHDAHLFCESGETAEPMRAHPAFGNAYDWHSSVHSHWTALALIDYFEKRGTGADVAAALRAALARNLTVSNLAAETVYLAAHPWYERPYGRAWALALAASAHAASHADARAIAVALQPLAQRVRAGALSWLAGMPAPVRHGVHSNTAFALGLMFDAARTLGFDDLAGAIAKRARAWFGGDRDYPQAWERSRYDFLSPGLAEADLMRRVLPRIEFQTWWRGFLGDLASGAEILAVAPAPDDADGQGVHLHGLNLSRAGMLARIASALDDDPALLPASAEALYRASLRAAAGDDYLSTHWLPTFAWDAAVSLDAVRPHPRARG